MPIDPQRLARVRAHLMAATALVAVGSAAACSTPQHTINPPPDPPSSAAPPVGMPIATGGDTPHINPPANINPPPRDLDTAPPPSATSPVQNNPPTGANGLRPKDTDKKPDPININTPRPH